MRVAIIGSRGFTRLDWVQRWLEDRYPLGTVIVSGGARGVDQEAADYARYLGYDIEVIRAAWDGPQGKAAGKERNWDIIERADEVVAFWDGQSNGTAHAIAAAVALGKPVQVFSTHPRAVAWRRTHKTPAE